MTSSVKRSVRVFVSSTFRDMQEERNELAKRTFVRLRKLCAEMDVMFTEVDLRWGISDEATAEGMVLPVCLEEIRACRPFFIGLLGERYGWVPESVQANLIEAQPWLLEHQGKSITELEILHGVMNDPTMAANSFFYFRDPKYAEEKGEDYITQDPRTTDKLIALKDSIRRSHLPVRENYRDPEELGELVYDDLAGLINRIFPQGSKPTPFQREQNAHDAYAKARTRLFVGHEEYFNQIDTHIRSSSQPLTLVGESGSGKSALLASWASRYALSHPHTFVLTHFVGAGLESAVWMKMVGRIAEEIITHFNLQLPIPSEPGQLKGFLGVVFHAVSVQSNEFILIIDGLDLIEDRDGGLDLAWLPRFLPAQIHLVLSALPRGIPMEELGRRSCPQLYVNELNETERRQVVVRYLEEYRKNLGSKRLERIVAASQCGNPLFLRLLLDELRWWGVYETLDAAIEAYLDAGDIAELLQKIIKRLEMDFERGRPRLVRDTLCLLWASRSGLSEVELLSLLGEKTPLARRLFSPLFLALESMLVSIGGLFRLESSCLTEAVEKIYLSSSSDKKQLHLQIAKYFQNDSTSPRALDELPWQYLHAEKWSELEGYISNRNHFELLWQRDRWEVRAYWARLETDAGRRMTDAYRHVLTAPDQYESMLSPLWELLAASGYLQDALKILQARIHACQKNGDDQTLELATGDGAQALIELGRLNEAEKLLEEQEQRPASKRVPREQLRLLHHKAMILQRRGAFADAAMLLETEASLARDTGDMYALSNSLSGQANILMALASQRNDLSALPRIEELSQEQERISRTIGDWDGLANSLQQRAAIRHCMHDSSSAILLFEEAEKLYRSSGNWPKLASCLGQHAVVERDLGYLEKALKYLQECETLSRSVSDHHNTSASLCQQADVFQSIGKYALALAKATEALRLAQETNNAPLIQFATMMLKGIQNKTR